MATIGRNRAVADIRGLKLTGPIAWMAWLFIHIINLIGFLIETRTFTSINPDVNLHVLRPHKGEWIAVVDSKTAACGSSACSSGWEGFAGKTYGHHESRVRYAAAGPKIVDGEQSASRSFQS